MQNLQQQLIFYLLLFEMDSTMAFIMTLVSMLGLCSALPNPASYIVANNRPLNIAHRGLSSIFPQNTLEAFEAALYQGADFIELDVVYTKQKFPLVSHDPYLSRLTNIADFPEFSNRKQTRFVHGQRRYDWWTDNFTISQLQKLTIKQSLVPQYRTMIFNNKFTFPLLKDVVEMVINFNEKHKGRRNLDGRKGGILIQAKNAQLFKKLYDLQIGETILQVLRQYQIDTIQKAENKAPIYLHSFSYATIKYWAAHTELPINYLLFVGDPYDLQDINKYATGIGFQDLAVWDYIKQKPYQVINKTKQLGMRVHVWTFRDDQLIFQGHTNIKMYKIAQNILQLDGVITQFSNTYASISQLLKN